MVGRELRRLEAAGILTSETIGRSRRYQVDQASAIAAEVRSLVAKTIGIEARLRAVLHEVPGMDEAFLFGSYARGTERPSSDLDVLVVGAVDRAALSERLIEVEQDLGRDINVTAYERAELHTLLESGDRFLRDVFNQPRVRLLPVEAAD